MGGGEARDIVFKSGEETDFTFPFALRYSQAKDPGAAVFAQLGQKCGFGGGARQNIVINYKLTVRPFFPLSGSRGSYPRFSWASESYLLQ